MTPATLQSALIGIAVSGWAIFAAAFLKRPRTPQGDEKKRDPRSTIAVAVQAIGFGLVWGWRREAGVNLLPDGTWQAWAQLVTSAVLAWGSAALAVGAVHALGKQWSVTARVLTTHQLITTGPYAIVRHPIYTAMLGLMLSTGIALTTWPALAMACVFNLTGILWRVRIEERLLREAFGAEHEAYVARVPAVIPGWRGIVGA